MRGVAEQQRACHRPRTHRSTASETACHLQWKLASLTAFEIAKELDMSLLAKRTGYQQPVAKLQSLDILQKEVEKQRAMALVRIHFALPSLSMRLSPERHHLVAQFLSDRVFVSSLFDRDKGGLLTPMFLDQRGTLRLQMWCSTHAYSHNTKIWMCPARAGRPKY